MGTIGIRDPSRNAGQVIDQVSRTGSPMIVTRQSRPIANLVAVDPNPLEDFVLATAPECAAAMRTAGIDLATGRTRPASAVFTEIRRSR